MYFLNFRFLKKPLGVSEHWILDGSVWWTAISRVCWQRLLPRCGRPHRTGSLPFLWGGRIPQLCLSPSDSLGSGASFVPFSSSSITFFLQLTEKMGSELFHGILSFERLGTWFCVRVAGSTARDEEQLRTLKPFSLVPSEQRGAIWHLSSRQLLPRAVPPVHLLGGCWRTCCSGRLFPDGIPARQRCVGFFSPSSSLSVRSCVRYTCCLRSPSLQPVSRVCSQDPWGPRCAPATPRDSSALHCESRLKLPNVQDIS